MKKFIIVAILITAPVFGAPTTFFIDNKVDASIEVQQKYWNGKERRDKYDYLATIAPKSRQQVTPKNSGGLVLYPKGPACEHMSGGDESDICANNDRNPIPVQASKTLEITQVGAGQNSLKWQWK